ncbi:hypothetical protein [Oceanicaulis alexandrii]|uniref:hypothetical protein n=1 Tax=Oceanicaulis alexandrii TaxID=153233 RepID=UPI0003B675A0|nr:hypothetical protein [Oceanicaulis alexandrii]
MTLSALALTFALQACAATDCDAPWPAPMRQAEGATLSSSYQPDARIELPETAVYAGGRRWALYDVVDAEMHLFVEAGEDRIVDRLYWIQFEAYLPNRPEASYDFHLSDLETRTLGEAEFFVRARFGEGASDAPEPGSDNAMMRAVLAEAGYTLPAETINATMKHLLDPDTAREELMIIYIEDLEPTGSTMAEIIETRLEGPLWAGLSQGVLDRAQERIAVRSTE